MDNTFCKLIKCSHMDDKNARGRLLLVELGYVCMAFDKSSSECCFITSQGTLREHNDSIYMRHTYTGEITSELTLVSAFAKCMKHSEKNE